jgi:serine/threonine-protein kinase
MPKTNDKIGPYILISKLGRGAFGVVWLAEKHTPITTTKVAIKFPSDEDVDLEAIWQEASLWVHASGHPNVLPIIDADIYDEQIAIVSEYASDGTLSKWLERHGGRAPSIEVATEMALGVLAGLEHLHKRGVIHRDLKPDNILLQNETPRLADFGIARILKTTSNTTAVAGTPIYMSPEAFDGKRSVQTDIWSVGVIFYQLLTGRLPFSQIDIASLIAAITTREPEPLPASIPKQLQNIIERTLKKMPAERFESAGEMRRALRDASKSLTSSIREVSIEALPSTIAIPALSESTQVEETEQIPPIISPIQQGGDVTLVFRKVSF